MEKYTFLRLNFDDAPEDLQEGDYTYALNLIPSKQGVGMSGGRESVGSTQEVGIVMPTGLNKQIGSVVYKKLNQLIFFVYNSLGNHTICKWEYGSPNAQVLLTWDGFNFQTDSLIRASIVDRFLVWTDGVNNARIIDLDKVSDGFYDTLSERKISFIKRGASAAPHVYKDATDLVSHNYIQSDNHQFAIRYIYFDNQNSPLSPYSVMVPARPLESDSNHNCVKLNFKLNEEETQLIKEVQVLVRKSNNDNFSIADKIKPESGTTSYWYTYIGNKNGRVLSDEEQTLSTNAIPDSPKNNAYLQNRLFLSGGTIGQDDLGDISFSTSISRGEIRYAGNHAKEGGAYEVGLVLYDANMKSIGVIKTSEVEVPLQGFTSNGYKKSHPYISCTTGGTAPSWAKYFTFAVKEEKTRDIYLQCPADVYFYVSDNRVVDKYGTVLQTHFVEDTQFLAEDKIYLKSRPATEASYSFIYLHVPKNIPFLPDTSYRVRILNDIGIAVSDEPIVDIVDGDKIVTNNFGVTDFTGATTMKWFIEIYANKTENEDDLFYETGDVYPIESLTGTKYLPGDTYAISHSHSSTRFSFNVLTSDPLSADVDYGRHTSFIQRVESPTPCFSAVSGGVVHLKVDRHKHIPHNKHRFLGIWMYSTPPEVETKAGREGRQIVRTSSYVLDYSKISSSMGKATIKPDTYKKISLDNTIRHGSTYVENSIVNSLADFSALDDFNISSDQGRNTLLIKAESVLLAINERSTTSIYVNQAFLNTSDSQQFLTKTEGVIADDRELKGSYGTVNPESVASNGDVVYWVDLHKGEVLRYNNGLTPIASTYKAKSYFRKRCEERASILHLNPKIYGGYDPYLDMYLVTFAPVGDLPGETIGFYEAYKSWVSFFSFKPDGYENINTKLLSFKDGKIYRHGESSGGYNKFYGTQYSSSIEFVANPEVDFEKTWENIATDSNNPCNAPVISNEKGQRSDLVTNDFKQEGSLFYADILRDLNTGSHLLKAGQIPLRHGIKLRSQTLTVKLEAEGDKLFQIQAAYIGYLKRSGQLIN